MIKQALLGEFLHEAENTRKLLKAIPDSASPRLRWQQKGACRKLRCTGISQAKRGCLKA